MGLEDRLAVPVDPQPGQILQYARDMLGPGARPVYILDPEQEGAAPPAGEKMGEQGRIGMAEVKPPGRARREAGNDRHQPFRS